MDREQNLPAHIERFFGLKFAHQKLQEASTLFKNYHHHDILCYMHKNLDIFHRFTSEMVIVGAKAGVSDIRKF